MLKRVFTIIQPMVVSQITAVNMHKINLDGQQLISYPMLNDEEFYEQN